MKRLLMCGFTLIGLSVGIAQAQYYPTVLASDEFAGSLYELRFVGMDISWFDAKDDCEADGGHLVSITSEQENETLLGLLQVAANEGQACPPGRYVWIGFTDQDQEGQWEWITGEPVSYLNWAAGEPNNMVGLEHWGHMYCPGFEGIGLPAGGLWNDTFEAATVPGRFLSYFCEFDCTFGPGEAFEVTRSRGKPRWEDLSWESCGGPGTLMVASEGATSALVYLNGALVATPDDFNPDVEMLEIPVVLTEGENVLTVQLRGAPGSSLSFDTVE